MSEVERYWIDPSRLVQEGWHQDDTCVVKDWAYDRVVAERDALQQRLTAADDELDRAGGAYLNKNAEYLKMSERADAFDRLYTASLDERDQLQQRVVLLEGLLREALPALDLAADAFKSAKPVRNKVRAALKAAEGGGDE